MPPNHTENLNLIIKKKSVGIDFTLKFQEFSINQGFLSTLKTFHPRFQSKLCFSFCKNMTSFENLMLSIKQFL